ncbi:active breakpoint cluster region-related protein-like isoform X2 [Asterias amurensis]|uniref:active breakpoint cluster region-related protein-like isoform X2 n=1 Tax=Asterias amurensis TaxID=7602 RepID=UPI003AB74C3C
MAVNHAGRRKTLEDQTHVTIQEQFLYEWKENFGDSQVPENLQFMKMTLPETVKPTQGEEGVATPAFNATDSLILANLEGDLKKSSTHILKLRNELKREKFCKEWLTKEIHRYNRASEGLDSRSTGSSEASELYPEEDFEALGTVKEELETPRASLEEDEVSGDSCDKKTLHVENDDDDDDDDDEQEPLYDNIKPQDDSSSDEDMEGIYENLDFLKKMQNGDASNEESEGEDVFLGNPHMEHLLTTNMRVSALIEGHDEDGGPPPRRPLRRGQPPVLPIRGDLPKMPQRDETAQEKVETHPSDNKQDHDFLSPNSASQRASSPSSMSADDRGSVSSTDPESSPSLKRPVTIRQMSGEMSPDPPSDDQLQHRLSSPEVEILNVRRLLLSGTLESELKYVQTMEELQKVMKTFKANMTTSQPMLTQEDYDTLFFKIPELADVHREFCNHMAPKLAKWSPGQTYGDSFKLLARDFGLHEEYVANYKKAMAVLARLRKLDERFAAISSSIKLQSGTTYTMESMLNTPLQRITKLTLVLNDLLTRTPVSHEDYNILAQVLEKTRTFFKQVDDATKETDSTKQKRRLIKDSYLVEFSEGRKLRHVLLWSDLIICTKEKPVSGMFHRDKAQYDCQWYMPLAELSLTPNERSEAPAQLTNMSDKELDEMKKSIKELKASARKDTNSGTRQSKQLTKSLESRRKEITEKEGVVIIESPKLPLHLYHNQGKTYTLLMSSDYERSEWKEAILTAKRECRITASLTPYHIEKLLTKCKRGRKINNIGSILIKDEEELLFGTLHVTVHHAKGLNVPGQLYCCVEVDSYGIISLRAKTKKSENSKMPTWDEEFALEVEGAQMLRILCYDYTKGLEDEMMDKGAKTLTRSEIGKKQISTTVQMEKLEVDISLKFESSEKALKRVQSKKKMGVFGVRISHLCQREGTKIPNIVINCVEEIDRRGISEMGIYRISGSSADILGLRKLFEMNSKHILTKLKQAEIHAVAGLIKRYFRDLPEPIFTQNLYCKIKDGFALKDPDAKRECMISIMKTVPEPNKTIIEYLFRHLKRVAENESVNKMHLHNLATVFGPTLLGPASKPSPLATGDNKAFMTGIMGMSDAMSQVGILFYYLEHYNYE